MVGVPDPQLTLDIHADAELEIVGVVSVSGSMTVDKDMNPGTKCYVQIISELGDVLASAKGEINSAGVRVVHTEQGDHLERGHKVKVI